MVKWQLSDCVRWFDSTSLYIQTPYTPELNFIELKLLRLYPHRFRFRRLTGTGVICSKGSNIRKRIWRKRVWSDQGLSSKRFRLHNHFNRYKRFKTVDDRFGTGTTLFNKRSRFMNNFNPDLTNTLLVSSLFSNSVRPRKYLNYSLKDSTINHQNPNTALFQPSQFYRVKPKLTQINSILTRPQLPTTNLRSTVLANKRELFATYFFWPVPIELSLQEVTHWFTETLFTQHQPLTNVLTRGKGVKMNPNTSVTAAPKSLNLTHALGILEEKWTFTARERASTVGAMRLFTIGSMVKLWMQKFNAITFTKSRLRPLDMRTYDCTLELNRYDSYNKPEDPFYVPRRKLSPLSLRIQAQRSYIPPVRLHDQAWRSAQITKAAVTRTASFFAKYTTLSKRRQTTIRQVWQSLPRLRVYRPDAPGYDSSLRNWNGNQPRARRHGTREHRLQLLNLDNLKARFHEKKGKPQQVFHDLNIVMIRNYVTPNWAILFTHQSFLHMFLSWGGMNVRTVLRHAPNAQISNLHPHAAFQKVLTKKIVSSLATRLFAQNVTPWYYNTVIQFLEHCSGLKVLWQYYPFLNQEVTSTARLRYYRWLPRMASYERNLGHRFFMEESLHIMHLSFTLRDPQIFSSWLKAIILRINFYKTRSIFRFLKYLFHNYMTYTFRDLGIKGLKIRLKGKISVAGNSRKRTIFYKTGQTSFSRTSLRVVHEFATISTFTGVLGFNVWLFY